MDGEVKELLWGTGQRGRLCEQKIPSGHVGEKLPEGGPNLLPVASLRRKKQRMGSKRGDFF